MRSAEYLRAQLLQDSAGIRPGKEPRLVERAVPPNKNILHAFCPADGSRPILMKCVGVLNCRLICHGRRFHAAHSGALYHVWAVSAGVGQAGGRSGQHRRVFFRVPPLRIPRAV